MVKKLLEDIIWLGQSGFIFNLSNKIITIDPFKSSCSIDSDIILITHPHWDHLSLVDIEKFEKKNTLIIKGFDPEEKIVGNVKAIKPWEEIQTLFTIIQTLSLTNIYPGTKSPALHMEFMVSLSRW